jgi:hypothetical protein
MNRLPTLKALIANLSSTEKSYCRHFLKTFNSIDNKSLKLFQLLEKPTYKEIRETDLCKALYGKRKSNSFARLQLRLSDKILDVITITHNLRRGGKRNEKNFQRVILRQRLNHADVLQSRQLFPIAKKILESVKEVAEKFELFDEALASLQLQAQLATCTKDFSKAQLLQLDVLYCRQRITVITTARQILVMMRGNSKEDIKERLKKLENYAKEAPSATYSFLLLGINVIEMQRNGNYKAAEELLTQQLTLASDHRALKNRKCIGGIYLELAKNSMQLARPEKAKEYLVDAEHWAAKDLLFAEELEIVRESVDSHAKK